MRNVPKSINPTTTNAIPPLLSDVDLTQTGEEGG
jgi:hypothetical protein